MSARNVKRIKRVVFLLNKRNRYSVTALIGAMEAYAPAIEVLTFRSPAELERFDPEETVVALSFSSFDVEEVRTLVPSLKEMGFTVIAGGPHPSADPSGTLALGVDHVFVGDGEETLLDYLKGKTTSSIVEGIPRALDAFPPFAPTHGMYMPTEITRGCPFKCAYCQVPNLFGRRVRHRSVKNVLKWARISVENSRKIMRFISPNAFGYGSLDGVKPEAEVIKKLLSGLRGLGIEQLYFGTFPSDVRPESVTSDILALIKTYCDNKSILIGAQSGSERILKLIRRGHTTKTVEKAVQLIHESGLRPHVDFIFGFPFEAEEDVEANIAFMSRLIEHYDAKIHAHTFMPLPGSDFAHLRAGRLNRRYRKVLGRYASSGILDGHWSKQEELSKRVSRLKGGRELEVESGCGTNEVYTIQRGDES